MAMSASIGNIGPFGRWDLPREFRTRIGPDLAKILLGFNTSNRRKLPSRIKNYTWAMSSGHWAYTGESISFDVNGVLRDGQNRLYAVVESGVEIEVLVVLGLDPAVTSKIGGGATRTGRQVLEWHERDNESAIKSTDPTITNAVALMVYQYEQGVRAFYNYNYHPHSPYQLVDFIQRRPEIVDSANFGSRASSSRSRAGIPAFPKIVGTMHYLAGKRSVLHRNHFFEGLESGVGLEAGDAILLCSRKLTSIWGRRNQDRTIRNQEMMQVIATAWNAYRGGQPIKQIRIEQMAVKGKNVPAGIPDLI